MRHTLARAKGSEYRERSWLDPHGQGKDRERFWRVHCLRSDYVQVMLNKMIKASKLVPSAEWREHEEAIKRLQSEHKRLQDRINVMYVDKLDGLVDVAFFEKMSNQWRDEQNRCLREIERHQEADKSYMDEACSF